jgi:deoxycytidylate deaminase
MSEPQNDWLGGKAAILVFALTGRIGSGTSFVADALISQLKTYDYEPTLIKVTRDFLNSSQSTGETASARIKRLQEEGNKLREQCGSNILGIRAIDLITKTLREKSWPKPSSKHRIAYVIDSLKNPEEIEILRQVFQENFWVIGVVSDDSTRKKRLYEQKHIKDDEFDEISKIDADQELKHGQKTIKTILMSDYFFANNYDKQTKIPTECQRFLNLLFQENIETPRQDEYGIHLATMAADKSACLSRQVGAAIITKEGTVIATGCNDVPQFGGGLYTSESLQDNRCFTHSRMCHNDYEKKIIAEEITKNLGPQFKDGQDIEKIKNILLENTRLKQLIEFSRAVHAEMDAIITVARSGNIGIVGSTMYVTTYPCHNCAKHIIDAGIHRVVFIEPYEKSLAQRLHSDAINNPLQERSDKKVSFDNYGGVSPERYSYFFSKKHERKRESKLIHRNKGELLPHGLQESTALKARLDNFDSNYPLNDCCRTTLEKAEVEAM